MILLNESMTCSIHIVNTNLNSNSIYSGSFETHEKSCLLLENKSYQTYCMGSKTKCIIENVVPFGVA